MSFDTLGLAETMLRAVRAEGYDVPTPIQLQAIPPILKGRDLMGCAQTGTGKTAAFALPTLQRLTASGSEARSDKRRQRPIRALVLAPTRELAAQIQASFVTYGKFTGLRSTVVYGGVSQHSQVRALGAGVDILVATPGRLLDLMNQGFISLKQVEILILDEADQMLDMGFLPDLRRIVSSVPNRDQTLMFSATMPPEIRQLAQKWLREPEHVQVTPVAATAELVEQSVFFVEPRNKPQLLTHFLKNTAFTRTLIFARTKHGADKIVRKLTQAGIRAAAIHGNKSQAARTRTLDQFKSNHTAVLVATDIAARGLDVDGISHVINYELPEVAETYVHRIGRTGRAGAAGIATSFCGRDERPHLDRIERLTRRRIRIETDQPVYAIDKSAPAEVEVEPKRSFGRSNSRAKPAGKYRSKSRSASAPAAPAGERSETAGSRPPRRRRRRSTSAR